MPQVPKNPIDRYKPLVALIRGTMLAEGVSVDEMCTATGLSRTTLYDRFKHPWDFTLGELSRVAKPLKLTLDELRSKAFVG